MNGDLRILYFYISSSWIPVGCLTGNSISESVDMIGTTTRENDGWSQAVPMQQSYSISFDAVSTLTGSIVNIDDLRVLFRARTRVRWKIEDSDGGDTYSGYGYMTSLSEGSPVGEYITFSCTLEGTFDITTT
jgi:hypothetical protein